jgi:hypothetical protein
VDHPACTHIHKKSGITDLKKLNVPLDTYYFCQTLILCSFLMSNWHISNPKCHKFIRTTKLRSFEQQNRNHHSMELRWRWPQRPQPTTNHETDGTNQHNVVIKVSLASFISVDCCLLFHFSTLIEMAPQWPWWQWWWWFWAKYPTDLAHTWRIAN